MDDLNGWGYQHTTEHVRLSLAGRMVDDAFQLMRPSLVGGIESFLAEPVSSKTFHAVGVSV